MATNKRTLHSCFFVILLLVSSGVMAWSDTDLLKKGQELRYKGQWQDAYQVYLQVVEEHPDSPYVLRARFYQAHCLAKQGKRKASLEHFELFLHKAGADHRYTEAAKVAIIELSRSLGNWARIEELAKDPNFKIAFFAAMELARNKRTAGVPVLIDALSHPDPKISERAKVYLYVLGDPRGLDALARVSARGKGGGKGFLSISIAGRTHQGAPQSVVVQEDMGDLLFDALPADQARSLEKAGVRRNTMSQDLRQQKEVKVPVKGKDKEIHLKHIPPGK